MIQFHTNLSEPDSSTMFLNHVTVVDHAYIDPAGRVIGGSHHPSFHVRGCPDPIEKVVVDFSAVKKDIKAAIDAYEGGFDHKLWIIEGWSKATILPSDKDTHIVVDTPKVRIELPVNDVKVISLGSLADTDLDQSYEHSLSPNIVKDVAGEAYAAHVQAALQEKYPNVQISVTCINSEQFHIPLDSYRDNFRATTSALPFRYVHGLRDSTSHGCKNIAHGHLSFLQIRAGREYSITAAPNCDFDVLLDKLRSQIDGCIFVRRDNIIDLRFDSTNNRMVLEIGYTTPRGDFKMTCYQHLSDKGQNDQPIHVLDTETTVEFLAEFVATQLGRHFKHHMVYVSEGLSKGAIAQLHY